ncbi:peptidoglycan-binding protein [Streptomyces sp. NPDC048362]|uniref:peptidoglycan-binding protein n=1 Tax=Streptomyces sp. NPDC048362 TaxID=3365539 RepID=UPI003722EA96
MVALSNVQFGKSNEDVRTVQRALLSLGYRLQAGATGYFGPETKAAYAAYQLSLGYSGTSADGNPGMKSLTTLAQKSGFQLEQKSSQSVAQSSVGSLRIEDVSYNDPGDDTGEAAMKAYALRACQLTGMDPSYGVPALVTITSRESAHNHPKYRVNTNDSNAYGPIMSDGHPQNCSRGATQCIPRTFARYHQESTATTPYDVVADMCATINYVRDRYHVNRSGSNFSSLVQQADPQRKPKGY